MVPKSLNAWEISAVKAPLDGDEIMKKYSIVRAVDDDGYVVAGSTPSTHFLGQMSVHVMKFNDNGNIDWSFYYNIPNLARNFETTHIDYNVDSNGYVMCGYTDAQPNGFGHSTIIPFILEIDDLGAVVRNTTIHLQGVFFKVKPTPKGDYIAVGYSGDSTLAGHKIAMCVKFNNLLTSQWIYAYLGQGSTTPSPHFFDGLQAVHVVYDGVNETYVLGGNSTGAFDINSTPPDFIPIIELVELNEFGVLINKLSSMPYTIQTSPPYNPVYGINIIVQDLVVVEDPLSPYYSDVFLLGQEIGDASLPRGPEYQLHIVRFKRQPFTRDSDFIPFHGDACSPFPAHHSCRGNNLTFVNDKLLVFGTMETPGIGATFVQIPFVMTIDPSLPQIAEPPCTPSNYPCVIFRDRTTFSESLYDGYRLQFPDYLGTNSPRANIQVYGQSLGYADKDGNGNIRYGVVSNKKINLTDPFWSLFAVSNINSYYCDTMNGFLVYEHSDEYSIDTFTYDEAFGNPYSESLTLDNDISNFTELICNRSKAVPEVSGASIYETMSMNNQIGIIDDISFYPNPAFEEIRLKGVKEGDYLKIRDINGKIIREITILNPIIDLSQILSGVYILQISRNQEIIFTGKLIK